MDKLLAGLVVAALLFVVSTINGTFLYFIYPHIHELFPTAASNGIIAKELSWWNSVCVVWIFGILIKSTQTNNNKK